MSFPQFYVVIAMLRQWCTNVMRSKVQPMKEVAAMILGAIFSKDRKCFFRYLRRLSELRTL
jgi:hypothetical protein